MLGEKTGKYLGDIAMGAVFINTFNDIRKILTSDEYKEMRGILLSHAGHLFGIGLADEAGFMVRAAKALTPAEFKRLTRFYSLRSPKERTKFRCSVAAIDFIEEKHTVTTGTGAKKVTDEFTTLKDPAHNLLKMIASSKLTDTEREEVCNGLGLFDFPFDPKDVVAWIDSTLTAAGGHIDTLRLKMDAAFAPSIPPANAYWFTRFFYWIKNL